MVVRADQGKSIGAVRASIVALVTLVVAPLALHADEPKDGSPQRPLRRRLDDACDVLRRSAVKGSYGWGWPSEIEPLPVQNVSSRNRVQPDIDLRVTAAAGLVLELAGRELSSEGNRAAAVEASRAIASVLLQTGQVPWTARLVPKPSGHQEVAGIVSSREPTSAALALMLTVINGTTDEPDPRITSAATRAATWLARQQTSGGGWQTAYPSSSGPKARRLIRLDGPEYRDATYALLLASSVLEKREYAMAADRCVEQLLRLRIRDESSPGFGLWGPAYTLGGDPVRDLEEIPYGIDVLASRYATETLFASKLVAGRKDLDEPLAAASKAMLALPKSNGSWEPRYPIFPRKDAPAPPSDEAKDDTSNDTNEDEKPKTPAFDDAGLMNLLTVVNQRNAPENFGPTERLAATVCHLSDDLLLEQPGATKRTHADLPDAVTNAWGLLLKIKSAPKTE